MKRSAAKHLKSICVKHFCFARRRRSTFRHPPPTLAPPTLLLVAQVVQTFRFVIENQIQSLSLAVMFVCFASPALSDVYFVWTGDSVIEFGRVSALKNGSKMPRRVSARKNLFIKNRRKKYTETLSHTRAVFGNRKRRGFFVKKRMYMNKIEWSPVTWCRCDVLWLATYKVGFRPSVPERVSVDKNIGRVLPRQAILSDPKFCQICSWELWRLWSCCTLEIKSKKTGFIQRSLSYLIIQKYLG